MMSLMTWTMIISFDLMFCVIITGIIIKLII